MSFRTPQTASILRLCRNPPESWPETAGWSPRFADFHRQTAIRWTLELTISLFSTASWAFCHSLKPERNSTVRIHVRMIFFAALMVLPGTALAQTDQHHVESTTGPLPQQCADMMPMMQQMMQMMQGGMGQGMPMSPEGMSEAGKAYMEAMKKMDMPMMQAAQASDPDVAFVRGMIPHHQRRDRYGPRRSSI